MKVEIPPSPVKIESLAVNQVYVFGSNFSGIPGKSAASTAKKFGAKRKTTSGPTGKCYALPTKFGPSESLPLYGIGFHIWKFLQYAIAHPGKEFLVTAVGCGDEGYSPEEIAVFFRTRTSNVRLPASFNRILKSLPPEQPKVSWKKKSKNK